MASLSILRSRALNSCSGWPIQFDIRSIADDLFYILKAYKVHGKLEEIGSIC